MARTGRRNVLGRFSLHNPLLFLCCCTRPAAASAGEYLACAAIKTTLPLAPTPLPTHTHTDVQTHTHTLSPDKRKGQKHLLMSSEISHNNAGRSDSRQTASGSTGPSSLLLFLSFYVLLITPPSAGQWGLLFSGLHGAGAEPRKTCPLATNPSQVYAEVEEEEEESSVETKQCQSASAEGSLLSRRDYNADR